MSERRTNLAHCYTSRYRRAPGSGNHRYRRFLYRVSQRIVGGFGLRLPATDADTRAWLRLKGIRDIGSGLVVLALMWTTDPRTVGIALLVLSFVAFGVDGLTGYWFLS
jgi:Domain of unknown function (DUF4267)